MMPVSRREASQSETIIRMATIRRRMPMGQQYRTSDPTRDDYNSDHFSGADYDGITSDGTGQDEYRGYLGTPNGTYRYFDPQSGDEGTL